MPSDTSAVISVVRRSSLAVAPDAFVFEIGSFTGFDTTGPGGGEVYDPRFHDIYYLWDFDDTYGFVAPANVIAGHETSSVGYGPMVSHTFRRPGSYNVTCLIVEPSSGKTTTASLRVTVGDPATVFGGANTVFMSPSGSFGNAPNGARLIASADLDAALSSRILGSDTRPTRLMLNRGERFTFSGQTLGNRASRRVPSLHIVAGPGEGAKPQAVCTGGFTWDDTATTGNGRDKDMVIQNIVAIGSWNSATETGDANTNFFRCASYSPNLLLLDGCVISGFKMGLYVHGSNNTTHRAVVFNDSTITNWRTYGISIGKVTAFAATGSAVRCHVDACSGQNQNGRHNEEGPIRFHNGDRLIVSNCDLFSRAGWTGLSGGYQAYQGCIRFNTDGEEATKANIQTTTMEGGWYVFEAMHQAPSYPPHAVNLLIERNYMLGCWQSSGMIRASCGGMTIRNNMMVRPDAQMLPGVNNLANFVGLTSQDGGALNRATPIRIYNNTMVNLMSPSSFGGASQVAMGEVGGIHAAIPFDDVIADNNVMHQPNLTSPAVADAPFTRVNQFRPREKGYKPSNTKVLNTASATPANGQTPLIRPDTGSAALGDALNDPVAYDDFYGNERPQYPSRGALEMP